MVCSKCGKNVDDGSRFCTVCGAPASSDAVAESSVKKNPEPTFHQIPKCTYCGNVAPWKVGPILRPMDYIIGGIFLIPFIFPGIIYIGTVALIRSSKNNREKICSKCNARNMFTNMY